MVKKVKESSKHKEVLERSNSKIKKEEARDIIKPSKAESQKIRYGTIKKNKPNKRSIHQSPKNQYEN